MVALSNPVLQAHSILAADLSSLRVEEAVGSHSTTLAPNERPGHSTINQRGSATEEGQNFLRCSPGQPRSSSRRKTLLCIFAPRLITTLLTPVRRRSAYTIIQQVFLLYKIQIYIKNDSYYASSLSSSESGSSATLLQVPLIWNSGFPRSKCCLRTPVNNTSTL